jgi:hypothetical protein
MGRVQRTTPQPGGQEILTVTDREFLFERGKYMSFRNAAHLVFCGFLTCAMTADASKAPNDPPQKMKADSVSTSTRQKTDACMLLTSAEIEAVHGKPVKEARPSVKPNGGMLISECLFSMTTAAKSVSVAVASPNAVMTSALTPQKYWQK